MKKILGLHLSTKAIGWAVIKVDDSTSNSKKPIIVKAGVRVTPIQLYEEIEFRLGDPSSINAERTMRRTQRINRHRYKLRRSALLSTLKEIGFINETTALSEGKDQNFDTYKLRVKALSEKVSKEEFARVLIMLNKKRGYKSNRKERNASVENLLDERGVSEKLVNKTQKDAQLSSTISNKKLQPSLSISDLYEKFEGIWKFQSQYYPNVLTTNNVLILRGLNKTASRNFFRKSLEVVPLKRKIVNKELEQNKLSTLALVEKITLSEIAYILIDLNDKIYQSSEYLDSLNKRTFELHEKQQTVGQYLLSILENNPNNLIKNLVFNRKDYITEFNAIWKEQAKHYKELDGELKSKVENEIIFYQRPLKSKKRTISKCKLERHTKTIEKNGVQEIKILGPSVAPFASPVYQKVAIWKQINELEIFNKKTLKKEFTFDINFKKLLCEELSIKSFWTKNQFLSYTANYYGFSKGDYDSNFDRLEGNHTQALFYKAFYRIAKFEGHPNIQSKKNPHEIKAAVRTFFETIGIDVTILQLDMTLTGDDFSKQPAYEFWHLLYSYEYDSSPSGIEKLLETLQTKYGFKLLHAQILSAITFNQKYSKYSVKALRKIYPFLVQGNSFKIACNLAGYKTHFSNNQSVKLNYKINELKKTEINSPTVHKILNQAIALVNKILENPNLGKPDAIHFELSPELKKNALNRKKANNAAYKIKLVNKAYRAQIQKEFDLTYVSRRDLVKYKLYSELKELGYKTLASSKVITKSDLFSDAVQIINIIPKSLRFDNSLNNKTIEWEDRAKGIANTTIRDYCKETGVLERYKEDVQKLRIGNPKKRILLLSKNELNETPLDREINEYGHISGLTKELFSEVCNEVNNTAASVTAKLRSDWKLNKILRKLNGSAFKNAGLIDYNLNHSGSVVAKIKDWTRYSDYRHSAIDAIVVAFTQPLILDFLKNLHNSSKNDDVNQLLKANSLSNTKNGFYFSAPCEEFEKVVQIEVATMFASYKVKNRVSTNNYNYIKKKGRGNIVKYKERTPRGRLHSDKPYKKTIFYKIEDLKLKNKFSSDKIKFVTNSEIREALLERWKVNDYDEKKAFRLKNSYSKNPVLINGSPIPPVIKLKIPYIHYTMRAMIAPNITLSKVVDKGLQKILINHLEAHGGNREKAFGDIEANLIWINKSKGLKVKTVARMRLSKAIPIRNSRSNDRFNHSTKENNRPAHYVGSYNNHHTVLYLDNDNVVHEELTSFFEVIQRELDNQPIIKTEHENGWKFLFSMKHNELFFYPSEEIDLSKRQILNPKYRKLVSKRLFRLQHIALRSYFFRHHLDSSTIRTEETRDIRWINLRSVEDLKNLVKLEVNYLGDIIDVI